MAGIVFDVASAPSQVDDDRNAAYEGSEHDFMARFRQRSEARAAVDSVPTELRLGQAAWAAYADARARQEQAAQVRAEADDYAAKVRAEADNYASKIRAEADHYAAKARTAADILIERAAAAEAVAAAKQQEVETALTAYAEAKKRADKAKADADIRAANFDRNLAELRAAVGDALTRL